MKAAIIGLGRIGFEFGLEKNRVQPASHFHCYLENSLIDKIAICDNNPAKVPNAIAFPQKNHAEIETYTGDYNIMMEHFQPDIVSICTPTSTHTEIACAVAKYKPKTIILEKPIAQSLAEADAIIEACEQNGVFLYVNYGRRWSEPYRQIARMSTSTDIVTMIGYHPGPLIRTGTHMIDVFNMMMCYDVPHREDVTVQAFGKPFSAEYMKNTDDYNINGAIQYGDDATAILIANQSDPKLVLFELDVTCKTFRCGVTKNGAYLATYTMTDSHRYDGLKEYEHLSSQYYWKENMLEQALRNIIVESTLSAPFSNGKSARETLRLALAMHYSAMNDNQVVSVKGVPNDYTVRSY